MKYYIARQRHYYGPQSTRYTLDTETVFRSRADALDEIKSHEQSVYHLAHNECSRPTLKVVSENQLTQGMQADLRNAR